MSVVKAFRDNSTGKVISCIQWEGNNLDQIIKFCLEGNVKYIKEAGELWIVVQPVQDKKGNNIPKCGVLGFVNVGDWITWNGIELFPIDNSYEGHFNFTEIKNSRRGSHGN